MADLGKIVVTDGGTYSAAVTYEKLTFVHYNDDAYLTLKTVKGVTPTDDGVNYRLFCKSAVTATTSKAGIVMPDGTTIGISNGKITAKTATQTTVGVTKGSNDIIVGKDGGLSLNTKFEQATALANIVAGEALKVVLGKVSKAIATTMNLDENALLKNMISGIDVNNGEKVPSSAFVHTLYERLGMGTDLSAGDAENVTQAVNALYSNLAGNYITKANGYKKISGVSDTKNFDPNVLGCCFLNGSTANLPTSYDSTYIALANGLSMCIPYFENGFVGMYVRTYNGQWFPWQKII